MNIQTYIVPSTNPLDTPTTGGSSTSIGNENLASSSSSLFRVSSSGTQVQVQNNEYTFNHVYPFATPLPTVAGQTLEGHIASLANGQSSVVVIAGEGDDTYIKQPLATTMAMHTTNELFQLIGQAKEAFPEENMQWNLRFSCYTIDADDSNEKITDTLATAAGIGSSIPNTDNQRNGPFSPQGKYGIQNAVLSPRSSYSGGVLLSPRKNSSSSSSFGSTTTGGGGGGGFSGTDSFHTMNNYYYNNTNFATTTAATIAANTVSSASLSLREDPLFMQQASGNNGGYGTSMNANGCSYLTVPGLWEIECDTTQDIEDICNAIHDLVLYVPDSNNLLNGIRRRHTINQLTLHQQRTVVVPNEFTGDDTEEIQNIYSRLMIVRLSRASSVTPPSKPTTKTSNSITFPPWVTALSAIFQAIEQRLPTIPFTTSRITLLLRDAFCGRIPSTFLVTVPNAVPLGIATLQFATRVQSTCTVLNHAVTLSPTKLKANNVKSQSTNSTVTAIDKHDKPKTATTATVSMNTANQPQESYSTLRDISSIDTNTFLNSVDTESSSSAIQSSYSSSSSSSSSASHYTVEHTQISSSSSPSKASNEAAAARALARHQERQRKREEEATLAKGSLLSAAVYGSTMDNNDDTTNEDTTNTTTNDTYGINSILLNHSRSGSNILPGTTNSSDRKNVSFAPVVTLATYNKDILENQPTDGEETDGFIDEDNDNDDEATFRQAIEQMERSIQAEQSNQKLPRSISSPSHGNTSTSSNSNYPPHRLPPAVPVTFPPSSLIASLPPDIAPYANQPMLTEPPRSRSTVNVVATPSSSGTAVTVAAALPRSAVPNGSSTDLLNTLTLASPTGRTGADLAIMSADLAATSRVLFSSTLQALEESRKEVALLKAKVDEVRANQQKQQEQQQQSSNDPQESMTMSQLNNSDTNPRGGVKKIPNSFSQSLTKLPRQTATSLARQALHQKGTSGGIITKGNNIRPVPDTSPGKESTNTIEAELALDTDQEEYGGTTNNEQETAVEGVTYPSSSKNKSFKNTASSGGSKDADMVTLRQQIIQLTKENKALAKAAHDYVLYRDVVESAISRLQTDVQRVATERDNALKTNKALSAAVAKERIASTQAKRRIVELEFLADKLEQQAKGKEDATRVVVQLREALKVARSTSSTMESSLSTIREEIGTEVTQLQQALEHMELRANTEAKRVQLLEAELTKVRQQVSEKMLHPEEEDDEEEEDANEEDANDDEENDYSAILGTAQVLTTLAKLPPKPPTRQWIPSNSNSGNKSTHIHTDGSMNNNVQFRKGGGGIGNGKPIDTTTIKASSFPGTQKSPYLKILQKQAKITGYGAKGAARSPSTMVKDTNDNTMDDTNTGTARVPRGRNTYARPDDNYGSGNQSRSNSTVRSRSTSFDMNNTNDRMNTSIGNQNISDSTDDLLNAVQDLVKEVSATVQMTTNGSSSSSSSSSSKPPRSMKIRGTR